MFSTIVSCCSEKSPGNMVKNVLNSAQEIHTEHKRRKTTNKCKVNKLVVDCTRWSWHWVKLSMGNVLSMSTGDGKRQTKPKT